MNVVSNRSISVQGTKVVRVNPSDYILIGSIKGEGATLENALSKLGQKRSKVEPWLTGVGKAKIDFGVPRLPEQKDLDVYTATVARHKHMLPHQPPKSTGMRKVFQTYSAIWSIENMSADEILILSDRLRFEAQPDVTPDESAEPFDAMTEFSPEHIQKRMSKLLQPAEDADPETYFLFRSQLSNEEFTAGVKSACENARENADMIAAGAGQSIGELRSISSHSVASITHATDAIHRNTFQPMLKEVDSVAGERMILSENPKPAEFSISLHLTFDLI